MINKKIFVIFLNSLVGKVFFICLYIYIYIYTCSCPVCRRELANVYCLQKHIKAEHVEKVGPKHYQVSYQWFNFFRLKRFLECIEIWQLREGGEDSENNWDNVYKKKGVFKFLYLLKFFCLSPFSDRGLRGYPQLYTDMKEKVIPVCLGVKCIHNQSIF